MSTKKANTTAKHMDILANALMVTVEPLVGALNFQMDDFGVLQEQHAAADTGHETPAMRDNGLRFLLGGFCQTLWRQNYGILRSRDGKQTYMNATQMFARSKTTKETVEQKMGKDMSLIVDADLEALRWYRINEERVAVIDAMLDAFKTVYRETFHEDWKPVEQSADAESKKKALNLTDEQKAHYLKLLGVAGAKNKEAAVA